MKGTMMKEHERVVLKTALPAEKLEAGDVGTVVHVYRDGRAYEVEFTTLEGKTAAVVTVEAAQVRPVGKREITHARELQAASEAMSTAELIFEKARSLPSDKQNEALRFVDFLLARRSVEAEAAEWRKLLRETQNAPGVSTITDDDIAREVAA